MTSVGGVPMRSACSSPVCKALYERGVRMKMSADEKVLFKTRFSRRIFFRPIVLALLCLVLAIIIKVQTFEYHSYVSWAFVGIGGMTLLRPIIHYFSSQFVVTNKRVIVRHGFIARRSYDMLLKKIESVGVNQGLLERLFWGSGTLVITGTGGTKEDFPNVGAATTFQKHLNEMLHSEE